MGRPVEWTEVGSPRTTTLAATIVYSGDNVASVSHTLYSLNRRTLKSVPAVSQSPTVSLQLR